ncbi:MAG: hypothetical protein IPM57_07190 [Oligoflexia bacterium]|nr:hypothetical protein [Oligoflexia bacterium]
MPRLFFIFLACFLFILQSPVALLANTKAKKTIAKPKKKIKQRLIEANIGISKGIENVAQGIDEGLSGKKTGKTNLTQFIIQNQFVWREGGNFLYRPHLGFRLHFPNLEDRLRLQFSTADDVRENTGINRSRVKTEPVKSSYGAGVGLVQKLGDINTEFEPRVDYQDRVLLSYILKFKSRADTTGKMFSIRPELQLFARTDSGLGEFFSINSDLVIYKSLVLTFVNEEQYVDMENMFSTNHGLVLSYSYSDQVSQNISYIIESISRPTFHLSRYTVATAVTHKIIKNILHYTIMPFLEFPRRLDYKGSPGISIEASIIF